jgi:hypothetical protein
VRHELGAFADGRDTGAEAHHAALEPTRSMALDVEYWPAADPTTATGTREQIMAAYRTCASG